jgi:hypothetical protein
MASENIQIHLNSKYASSYNNSNNADCNFLLPNIEADDGYYIHISVISPYHKRARGRIRPRKIHTCVQYYRNKIKSYKF